MGIEGIDDRIVRIESFDGTLIATASWGDKDLPTVILSNGICCTDTYWTYLQPVLVDAGYRVVFFDYRGHNRSAAPRNPNEVTLPAHARDLWKVADYYEVDKAVLMGHSMGVQTIFEAYRQHPRRVEGLIALAGPFEYPLDHLYMTPAGAVLLAGLELIWKYSPSTVRTVWELTGLDTHLIMTFARVSMAISRQAPGPLVKEYFQHVAALDPILIIKMFRGMQMHSARDMLPQITVPVLQLAGGRDMLTPLPLQRTMASMLPDVDFEVFEKASHTLPVDEPERVNKRVLEFLSKVYQQEGEREAAKEAKAAAKAEAIPQPRAQRKAAPRSRAQNGSVKSNGAATAAKATSSRSKATTTT